MAEWGGVPAYTQSLETTLGAGALARLDADIAEKLPNISLTARAIYDNFTALMR